MPITSKRQPYRLNKLLLNLSSVTEGRGSSWERSLSDQAQKFYDQQSIQGQQENACFVPTRQMVRDLLTGTASSGGDLVAASVLAVASSVRPVSVFERAGAQRLEVSGDSLTLPRWTKADAGWIGEGENFTALGTTVSSVDATPKLASARLSFSRRLKVLSDNVESQVLAEVGRAVTALIEKGAIQGTGTNSQPLGLLNLPSALSQTFAAATPTSDELAFMLEKLGDADVDISKVVFLLHPSTAADLMKARVDASSGALVLSDLMIHGLPVFVSTGVTEGKVIALDSSVVRMIYFGAPQIVVDPYRGSTNGVTHVQVLNAFDLAVMDQSAICIGSA